MHMLTDRTGLVRLATVRRKAVRAMAALAAAFVLVVPSSVGARAGATARMPGALWDVSCPTASFCMAVGFVTGASGGSGGVLAYRWDGSAWSLAPMPAPPGLSGGLMESVSCASASFCAAIGFMDSATGRVLVAEKWNGASWQPLSINRPGDTAVVDVSCPAVSRCFAVGTRYRPIPGHFVPRGIATAWVLRAGTFHLISVEHPSRNTGLSSVSCVSARNCTAVGAAKVSGLGRPLIEHWLGSQWHEIAHERYPDRSGDDLDTVSCPAVGTCVAAGDQPYFPVRILVEQHRNGGPWHFSKPAAPGTGQPFVSELSCLNIHVCALGGGFSEDTEGLPMIGWRDRQTGHFMLAQFPSYLRGVSCAGQTCTYVGHTSSQDGSQFEFPVIYRGRGLNPAEQIIPAA